MSTLAAAWPESGIQTWQLWQMVATLAVGRSSGLRALTAPDGRPGLEFADWSSSPSPYSAWHGFYRSDRGQWYGYTLYLVSLKATPQEQFEEFSRVSAIYDCVRWSFELEPMINGFVGIEVLDDEAAARRVAERNQMQSGFRRALLTELADVGGWQVRVEGSGKPLGLGTPLPMRIAARHDAPGDQIVIVRAKEASHV
ncbi:MAG: hypothetical protein ACREU7_07780 [Burkholderiales bacterium]